MQGDFKVPLTSETDAAEFGYFQGDAGQKPALRRSDLAEALLKPGAPFEKEARGQVGRFMLYRRLLDPGLNPVQVPFDQTRVPVQSVFHALAISALHDKVRRPEELAGLARIEHETSDPGRALRALEAGVPYSAMGLAVDLPTNDFTGVARLLKGVEPAAHDALGIRLARAGHDFEQHLPGLERLCSLNLGKAEATLRALKALGDGVLKPELLVASQVLRTGPEPERWASCYQDLDRSGMSESEAHDCACVGRRALQARRGSEAAIRSLATLVTDPKRRGESLALLARVAPLIPENELAVVLSCPPEGLQDLLKRMASTHLLGAADLSPSAAVREDRRGVDIGAVRIKKRVS